MSRRTAPPVPVYLDHNATTPLRPEVRAAITDALDAVGNPSSVHRFGRRMRGQIEAARAQLAAALEVTASQVVFTSGGTEANAIALGPRGGRIRLVSAVEHPSVLAAADRLVPVDPTGRIDLGALDVCLATAPGPALVSVMLANNETGVIQPVAEAAAIAHRYDALVHCDAVQAFGRLPVALAALGVDFLTVSAHKIGGPPGVGALVARAGLEPAALYGGGGQEWRRRPGTENGVGIIGFGVAAARIGDRIADQARLGLLRDRFEAAARQAAPAAVIAGALAPRLSNTSCVALPGRAAETQVIALDLAGIAVSAGAACSSGKMTRSHVLAAMGLDDCVAAAAIRISLGWTTVADDIDRLAAAWVGLAAAAVPADRGAA